MMENACNLEDIVKGFENLKKLPTPEMSDRGRRDMLPQQYYTPVTPMQNNIPEIVVSDVEHVTTVKNKKDKRQQSSIDLMVWTIEKVQKIIVNNEEDTELFYRIYPAKMWVHSNEDERSFIIPEKIFRKQIDTFRIFSENGIIINDTKRDALQRMRNILFSKAFDVIEYPYSPGWNGGLFQYNKDSEISKLVNTPFLSKKLDIDEDMTQKKAVDILFQQLSLVKSRNIRLFIILIMHYALLFNAIKEIPRLNILFGIYGEREVLSKMAYIFFQFYDRNIRKTYYLHERSTIKELKTSKDEVFVITDNNTDTPYNRQKAEKNLSDISDIVFGDECNSVCLTISDCGIIEPDEDIFHVTVFQNDIEIIKDIQKALGTHIKFFTEWVAKNSMKLRSIPEQAFLDPRKQKIFSAFFSVYEIIKEYYNHIGGRSICEFFCVESDKEIYYLIKKMIYEACMDYQGEWMCDSFKAAFDDLNFKRVYPKDVPVNFDSNEPFVYVRKDSVCLRRKDMNLFLKYFPKGIRIVDILKTLKKNDCLEVDGPKRYEKNVNYHGKPRKMIVIKKEFLIPTGLTIEGGW